MLLFGCFYRSPTPNSTSDKNNDRINRLLKFLSKTPYAHKCRVGDFNYRDINWVSWTTFHSEDSKEHKFIETIRDCYLHQHNEENSRRRGKDQPSLIDLIFTDESMQIEVMHHAPLGKSDHNVICFKFNCYLDYSKPKEIYQYTKADFEAMRRHLTELNWKEKYIATDNDKTSEELWAGIKSMLVNLRKEFVPKRKSSGKPTWKDSGIFPISKALQDAIRRKHLTHRRWVAGKRHGQTDRGRLNYTRARNKVTKLMRQAKRSSQRIFHGNVKATQRYFGLIYLRKKMIKLPLSFRRR